MSLFVLNNFNHIEMDPGNCCIEVISLITKGKSAERVCSKMLYG